MKKLLTMSLLLISGPCFAETREILCQEKPGMSQGAMALHLSNENLSSQNNLFRVVRASWAFKYSGASMICSNQLVGLSGTESLQCIGYNSAGGLTEVAINLNNGAGSATVRSLGEGVADNIYAEQVDGMTLPCQVVTR